ncbi:hypothetical protein ACS0TY_015992 [Phlomoides rotata]
MDRKIEENKAEIERLDIMDDVLGLESEEEEQRRNLMNDLMKETSWREKQLFQKARVKWIKEGDANSKFFHNWVKKRYKRNEFSGLWQGNVWLESVVDVKAAVQRHFKAHFESAPETTLSFEDNMFHKKLEAEDNMFLETEGGLGFKDLEMFNKALVGKWVGRFLVENDRFWVKVIKSRYGGFEWSNRRDVVDYAKSSTSSIERLTPGRRQVQPGQPQQFHQAIKMADAESLPGPAYSPVISFPHPSRRIIQ